MVQVKKPSWETKHHSEIVYLLAVEPNNSYQMAKIVEETPSAIYKKFQDLIKDNLIIESPKGKNFYQINFEQIYDLFIELSHPNKEIILKLLGKDDPQIHNSKDLEKTLKDKFSRFKNNESIKKVMLSVIQRPVWDENDQVPTLQELLQKLKDELLKLDYAIIGALNEDFQEFIELLRYYDISAVGSTLRAAFTKQLRNQLKKLEK